MAGPKYYEGQEFVSDEPAKPTLVYRGGKFYPKNEQPGGEIRSGDEPAAPLTPGSEIRPRINMGLGPAIAGQVQMFKSEGWGSKPDIPGKGGHNPFDKEWGAKNLSLSAESGKPTILGYDKQALAKKWGGYDYQAYDQAAKSWEAAVLPILAGSAVTISEAERQIRAQLPQMGDDPRILAAKANNRAMMTNTAADLGGRPRPFPRVGTMPLTGALAQKGGGAAAASSAAPAGGGGSAPARAGAKPVKQMSNDDLKKALGI